MNLYGTFFILCPKMQYFFKRGEILGKENNMSNEWLCDNFYNWRRGTK